MSHHARDSRWKDRLLNRKLSMQLANAIPGQIQTLRSGGPGTRMRRRFMPYWSSCAWKWFDQDVIN
eukprot:6004078-Amphidinium_carterae.1